MGKSKEDAKVKAISERADWEDRFADKDYGWLVYPQVDQSRATVTLSTQSRYGRYGSIKLSVEDARLLAAELLNAAEWAQRKEIA